jgi:enoyl-CoA hydratase
MFRRVAGPQAAADALLFGEILDGAEAERVGLVWRCVDDDELLATAHELAARAAAAPRELVVKVKETLGAMAGVATHDEAVDLELDPQVWSLHQPAFAERLAALQAKISRR